MGKRVAVPMRLRENECQPAELVERQFTTEQRDEMAKSGHAMADGSFPIETVQDLADLEILGQHPALPINPKRMTARGRKSRGTKANREQ